jgi:hypothetical protein
MATGRVPTTANSPLTAKGDLFTYSTAPARLAVGNNGESLVADSSTSTGLRYTGNYAAGKNAIINGDFRVNQRGFTSSTSQGYGFDRWRSTTNGGTVTYSAQTFTAGTAPVAGYEGINFARMLTASQSAASDYAIFLQPMEDCRLFAGQTITVSFWAKAASATPKVAVEFVQNFGSGGSADVNTYAGQVTLSTSWARYSVTGTVPSISGKTIGTGSSLSAYLWSSAGSTYNSRTGSIGIQNNTVDYWGVQIEAGSVATAFQTATGTLQGELAACQRYYWRAIPGTLSTFCTLNGFSTANAYGVITYPMTMRTAPTLGTTGTAADYRVYFSNTTVCNAVPSNGVGLSTQNATLQWDATGGCVANAAGFGWSASSGNGYLEFKAEL